MLTLASDFPLHFQITPFSRPRTESKIPTLLWMEKSRGRWPLLVSETECWDKVLGLSRECKTYCTFRWLQRGVLWDGRDKLIKHWVCDMIMGMLGNMVRLLGHWKWHDIRYNVTILMYSVLCCHSPWGHCMSSCNIRVRPWNIGGFWTLFGVHLMHYVRVGSLARL